MKLRRLARHLSTAALAPVEALLVRDQRYDAHGPPCFVVGPPRSGTTIVYEALVTRFRTAYFSNLAHRLHRTPAAATRFGRRIIAEWRGDFASAYGHIEGWGSPSEAGWIWRRWIPEESHLAAATSADARSGRCAEPSRPSRARSAHRS